MGIYVGYESPFILKNLEPSPKDINKARFKCLNLLSCLNISLMDFTVKSTREAYSRSLLMKSSDLKKLSYLNIFKMVLNGEEFRK